LPSKWMAFIWAFLKSWEDTLNPFNQQKVRINQRPKLDFASKTLDLTKKNRFNPQTWIPPVDLTSTNIGFTQQKLGFNQQY
jgi:hypothetical protein